MANAVEFSIVECAILGRGSSPGRRSATGGALDRVHGVGEEAVRSVDVGRAVRIKWGVEGGLSSSGSIRVEGESVTARQADAMLSTSYSSVSGGGGIGRGLRVSSRAVSRAAAARASARDAIVAR